MRKLLILSIFLLAAALVGCSGPSDDIVEPWEADNDGSVDQDLNDSGATVDDSASDVDNSAEDDLDAILSDFNESDDEALLDDVEVDES